MLVGILLINRLQHLEQPFFGGVQFDGEFNIRLGVFVDLPNG